MKLSQFKFKLPEEQIALYPSYNRDDCRMMVVHRKSNRIDMYRTDENGAPLKNEDGTPQFIEFRHLIEYFDEGDVFVFNDTKVFPARLYGTKEKTDAKIEVFLLRELNETLRLWDVLVEPARKIRIGNKLFFDDSNTMVAEVIDNTTSRGRTLRFLYDCPHDKFKKELFALGSAPLPRYIIDHESEKEVDDEKNPGSKKIVKVKDRPVTPEDMEDFQCIYAKNEGAVTAPASGLHFSRELMKRMEIKGIDFAFITLHCALGCFHNIEVEDLTKHKMDSEQMFVEKETCEMVNRAKMAGKHICAVGTSVIKATETAVGTDGQLKEYEGWTNKFIFPPYESMVCNFYHPLSTLLMSACAFGGYDLVMQAYQMALDNGYRFGCFGDAMLILDD